MDMSTALGAYLTTLREAHGLDRPETHRRIEAYLGRAMDDTRLWRAESGKAWPQGDFLIALLAVIGGSLDDVAWIAHNPNATVDEAQARAMQQFERSARQMPDEELEETIRVLELLRRDPKRLGRWLEYGERLRETRTNGG